MVSASTLLRVPDLLHATDHYADGVLSGRYDHLLRAGGVPSENRWFTRIHGDDELDMWLISCSGAFDRATRSWRLAGCVDTAVRFSRRIRWDGKQLRRRRLGAGDQAAFPLGWVHNVVWAPDGAPNVAPSLSVHAYSPPLTVMSYYDVTDHNTLRRKRTELTDCPEGS